MLVIVSSTARPALLDGKEARVFGQSNDAVFDLGADRASIGHVWMSDRVVAHSVMTFPRIGRFAPTFIRSGPADGLPIHVVADSIAETLARHSFGHFNDVNQQTVRCTSAR
jgi:hypothetical protein